MLSGLYKSVSPSSQLIALHRDIDISFFVITVDLWDEEAQKEVNLVKHAANSPSISTASAVAYPQTPIANVCLISCIKICSKLTNCSPRHKLSISIRKAIMLRPTMPSSKILPAHTTQPTASKGMPVCNPTTVNMGTPNTALIIPVLGQTIHNRMVNSCTPHPAIRRTW